MNLEEIKKRHSDASTGPWIWDARRHTHDCIIYVEGSVEEYGYISIGEGGIVGSSEWTWVDDHNGEFIANSWQDVKDLIAEVERLQK